MTRGELERLAAACVFPGFEGPVAPDWIRHWIGEGLGGVVLFAWNVESREQLAELTALLRAEREDVLVAIDEEGGDVTRLEAGSGSSYPGNAALGVVDDVLLTEEVAAAIGADLADAGVDVDLAPVADVNTNPLNPVIGIRSFGPEPDLVARHVAAFVRGLQRAGVVACAKHFPGHGDTSTDSHLELPVVETLDPFALEPFRAAIEAGVGSIMTAHIVVRSLGDEPSTTSRRVLRDLLRDELRYDGLVITDALEMRAISSTIGVEEGAVRAIAGHADALCLGHDLSEESVRSVCDALVGAVQSGRLPEDRLAEAAGRVARTAEWARAGAHGERSDVAARRNLGREAARRALEVSGPVSVDGPALVVELAPEPGIAAGRLPEGPGDWLRDVLPDAELVRLDASSLDGVVESARGRKPVVVVRDAHRHAWQRDAVQALLARRDDVIVVETGLPHWRPSGAAGYVATYGAGRVNVESAGERLYSSSRRGVEQSGSSPGS
jgi:beta-N-acetylhexosaminidase